MIFGWLGCVEGMGLRSKFVINKALSITSAFPRRDLGRLARMWNPCTPAREERLLLLQNNDYLIRIFQRFPLIVLCRGNCDLLLTL